MSEEKNQNSILEFLTALVRNVQIPEDGSDVSVFLEENLPDQPRQPALRMEALRRYIPIASLRWIAQCLLVLSQDWNQQFSAIRMVHMFDGGRVYHLLTERFETLVSQLDQAGLDDLDVDGIAQMLVFRAEAEALRTRILSEELILYTKTKGVFISIDPRSFSLRMNQSHRGVLVAMLLPSFRDALSRMELPQLLKEQSYLADPAKDEDYPGYRDDLPDAYAAFCCGGPSWINGVYKEVRRRYFSEYVPEEIPHMEDIGKLVLWAEGEKSVRFLCKSRIRELWAERLFEELEDGLSLQEVQSGTCFVWFRKLYHKMKQDALPEFLADEGLTLERVYHVWLSYGGTAKKDTSLYDAFETTFKRVLSRLNLRELAKIEVPWSELPRDFVAETNERILQAYARLERSTLSPRRLLRWKNALPYSKVGRDFVERKIKGIIEGEDDVERLEQWLAERGLDREAKDLVWNRYLEKVIGRVRSGWCDADFLMLRWNAIPEMWKSHFLNELLREVGIEVEAPRTKENIPF